MSPPLHILLLCGGQSTEHEISILSASNIARQLNPQKYQLSLAYITHDGSWQYFSDPATFFTREEKAPQTLYWMPGQKNPFYVGKNALTIDCVFPILHGTYGEDGTIQGLLELLQVPFVSTECLGSAIAMDKDVSKRLLRDAGIKVVEWRRVKKTDVISYSQAQELLGNCLFIKPNSLGSSIGTRKVKDAESFHDALQTVFQLDEYALIERAIVGREIECSVLGNDHPKASLPGEIINHTEFYSYEAKYVDAASATVKTPADLPAHLISTIQALAIRAYHVLRAVGMARVDFFLTAEETLYINEINTLPGFTAISLYPKNWEASGLSYTSLLDELIQLGLQRTQTKRALRRTLQQLAPSQ